MAQAVLQGFPDRSLEEISVQEICDAVPVSAGTFFNYFASKRHLVLYLTQLIQIDLAHSAEEAAQGSVLRGIETYFFRTAELMEQYPFGMQEIIAAQALMREPPVLDVISAAERHIAFPGEPVADLATGELIVDAFTRLVGDAAAQGELPASTDPDVLGMTLHAIYFGVPMTYYWRDPSGIAEDYRRQLAQLW